MTNKSRECVRTARNASLPTTTSSEWQDHGCKMAGEISEVADKIKWYRHPEISEIERTAATCSIAGYCCLEEVMATSETEREPLYKSSAGDWPAWAQAFRKILDSIAPTVEAKVRAALYKEVDLYAESQACDLLSGTGEISRPRQEAPNMSSAALREGMKAGPLYTASLETKLSEAPWAPQGAAHQRANGRKEVRRKTWRGPPF